MVSVLCIVSVVIVLLLKMLLYNHCVVTTQVLKIIKTNFPYFNPELGFDAYLNTTCCRQYSLYFTFRNKTHHNYNRYCLL